MSGEKNDDDYLSELFKLKAQLAAAERKEAAVKPRDLSPLRAFLASNFEDIYLTFTREEKRQLWAAVIDRIVVDGNHIVDVECKS
jgi:hypothetical protein